MDITEEDGSSRLYRKKTHLGRLKVKETIQKIRNRRSYQDKNHVLVWCIYKN